MSSSIDFPKLAALVKAKRGSKGLREVAEEIGEISPSTLSRIEGERANDLSMSIFLRICDWLGIKSDELIKNSEDEIPPDISEADAVALHLRASKKLDPKTAKMLAEMVKAAYREVENQPEDEEEDNG